MHAKCCLLQERHNKGLPIWDILKELQYRELSRYCNSLSFMQRCVCYFLIQVFLCLSGSMVKALVNHSFAISLSPDSFMPARPGCSMHEDRLYPFHVLLRAVKVTINDVGRSCVDICHNICRIIGSGYFVDFLIFFRSRPEVLATPYISCRFSILGLV